MSFYNEDVDLVKINQDKDFNDKKITNIHSTTFNRKPKLDIELANKKNLDDELDKNAIVRFNQTLQNYLKVSVGSDTYNLTKYDKIQTTDTTEIKYPNSGGYLLQNLLITCNDKNNNGEIQNFVKSTKPNSPKSTSGATSSPPVGNAFMYIETLENNHRNNVYVIWERTDIIQISNISFYYNRYSILTNNSLKAMGRFRIQIMLKDGAWSTRYSIPKNYRYSDTSTDWTLVSLNFTEGNYGIRMYYDQIISPHADMCFSDITIKFSVY